MIHGACPTRVAATFLNRYGEDADGQAAEAARMAIARGNDGEAADWREVAAAIHALQAIGRADPPRGARAA